jgi:hypothetical protein
VGAAFFVNTTSCGASVTRLDAYSSAGGAPILFDTSGKPLSPAIVRQKPDFVGPDGVNTTFFGFIGITDNSMVPQCANNATLPNYFGTSAAAPHAAGLAALMLQANSALTPAPIYQILRASAAPMGGQTPNFDSGYGFIQATAAMATPALTLGASAIAVGNSTTLTWITADAASCTASGSWSGTQTTSGSMTLTPSSAGSETYTLACSNTGVSGSSSVMLQVTGGPSSGGGGGALDGVALLALGGLACRRWRCATRSRQPTGAA